MYHPNMIHKITLTIEGAILILLSINTQSFFATLSAIVAAWYYVAMFKINVIDTRYNGSWKEYVKQKLNL
jgi:hypothetical protein